MMANDTGWYTIEEFVKAFPKEFRSVKSARNLASMRDVNGLEEMGACVKKPGRPIMFNRANYEKWLVTPLD